LAFGVLGPELEVGVIGEVVNGNSGGTYGFVYLMLKVQTEISDPVYITMALQTHNCDYNKKQTRYRGLED
jgi:hypothetical protein